MNRQFNNDGRLWKLWISDAAQAFLQGRQHESGRGGPLFMEPPRDPIQVEAGSFPSDFYQIQGNCYGLANAPRVWYNKVKESMLKSGFLLHSFDRCFFQHFDGGGQLDAMAIVHVDDFLVVYSETFNLSLLEEMFRWGSVTKVDEDNPGVYRGKEISCIREKDNKRTLKVTQKAFVENLVEGRIKKGRLKDPDQKLTPEEWHLLAVSLAVSSGSEVKADLTWQRYPHFRTAARKQQCKISTKSTMHCPMSSQHLRAASPFPRQSSRTVTAAGQTLRTMQVNMV